MCSGVSGVGGNAAEIFITVLEHETGKQISNIQSNYFVGGPKNAIATEEPASLRTVVMHLFF
jgi:hypothetical protein